ncbi:MAG TPA: hypothetical protein VL854_06835 [Nitrososphaeraceae archaeon]|nr:hypothetical protein [Nitrososphaeraceae archaeon]
MIAFKPPKISNIDNVNWTEEFLTERKKQLEKELRWIDKTLNVLVVYKRIHKEDYPESAEI